MSHISSPVSHCSPACIWALFPLLFSHTKQAQHTQTHKICIATNISIITCHNKLSWSMLMKQECTEWREAHLPGSRFVSSSLGYCKAFCYSLSASAGTEISPSNCLRCEITSIAGQKLDIRCMPVWSHRWRRWWSWKLAAISLSWRQFPAGELNKW